MGPKRNASAEALAISALKTAKTVLRAKARLPNFSHTDVIQRMAAKAGLGAGDAMFFSAGKAGDAYKLAGAARAEVAKQLGLDRRRRI